MEDTNMSGFTSGITSGGCLYVTEYPLLDMKKITCTPDYFITTFKDGVDNILSYYSTIQEYCNMDVNVDEIYRCISGVEDEAYKAIQKAAIEEIINLMGGNE